MTWDDLRDKPLFRDVAAEFVEFSRGAEWVIHNAPFDVGFLDAELARIEGPRCAELASKVVVGADRVVVTASTAPADPTALPGTLTAVGTPVRQD